jgi:2-polyprenyl-6-methoxyphenol hydroxylase-like FAD-dependent oxidoreductase
LLAHQRTLGKRALVVGSGVAGLLAARVLSDHFEQVLVLERDAGFAADGARNGLPQGRLVHGVLRGGLDRINALFPGFEIELVRRGAVPSRPARDVLLYDALGLWPRQDVGLDVPMLSRTLLEQTLRDRLLALGNVELRGGVTVHELIARGERVVGVVCRYAAGGHGPLQADLIVDASGRMAYTPEWLQRIGFAAPEETRVELDVAYAGCRVRPKRPPGLLGASIHEPPPYGRYAALAQAQEGGSFSVALAGRGRDTRLANDYAGLLAIAERLPHPAVFELLRDADPIEPIARFNFPASVQRHYERLERFPLGLLCIGDALCSFNPIWGQGMSAAALEAEALARVLSDFPGDADSLTGLAAWFFAAAARVIATPWALSVGPDLAYATARVECGSPPTGRLGFSRALARLAQQEPEIRALTTEVYHLVKPREALLAPELLVRIQPFMSGQNTPEPKFTAKAPS